MKSRSFAVVSLASAIALSYAGTADAAAPARGRVLFIRCASCHDISDKVSPKTGPNLAGVYGRRAGSQPGYAYSAAMKAQTLTWDQDTLDRWLTKPTALVPGTSMAFGGIATKTDRSALIDYLRNPVK